VTSASQPAITSVGTLTSLAVSGAITGNGAGLSNIVTSIIAGTGISVNQATGAVTITNTGGGGNSSVITSGNSYANVGAVNGRVVIYNGPTTANIANLASAPNAIVMFNDPGNNGIFCGSDGNVNLNANGTTGFLNLSLVKIRGGTVDASTIDTNILITAPNSQTGTSAGTAGQIAVDANYIYVCTASNTWKRVALSSF
jgi:hypothetical protein